MLNKSDGSRVIDSGAKQYRKNRKKSISVSKHPHLKKKASNTQESTNLN